MKFLQDKKDKVFLVLDFLMPLLILTAASIFIGLTDADLYVSGLFYNTERGWFLSRDYLWFVLYHYGMAPAFLIALIGLAVFGLSFLYGKLSPWRMTGLFFVLLLIIGPGLIVNAAFKDHWGRHRPIDIIEFGGNKDHYRPFWERGVAGEGKSFPSGHASVGFFLFAPFFLLRKKTPSWAYFFLFLGLFYGSLMGAGRIVQGGHFLSDVLWSGGFLYLTGLALSYLFKFHKDTG